MMFFVFLVVTGTCPKRFSHPNSKFRGETNCQCPEARKPPCALCGTVRRSSRLTELHHNDYDLTFSFGLKRLAAALGNRSWDIVRQDAVPGFSVMAALGFLQEAKLDLPVLISKDSRGDTAYCGSGWIP
jgi:hypothetical protein